MVIRGDHTGQIESLGSPWLEWASKRSGMKVLEDIELAQRRCGGASGLVAVSGKGTSSELQTTRLPDLQAITSKQQDLCQKWIGLALFVPLSGLAYPQIDVDLAAP